VLSAPAVLPLAPAALPSVPEVLPPALKALSSASEVLPSAPHVLPTPQRVETPRPETNWATDKVSISTAGSFAYPKIHPAIPLPATSFAAMRGPDAQDGENDAFNKPRQASMDFSSSRLHMLTSRSGLCSAVVSVARANELPIPFFANLIWQESSFQSKTISTAGALGIAQFMPETAVEHGLMNPFEPMHALLTAGKRLRKLNEQFGNLGLAAAAYNAGPQRVRAWMAERRTLPSETRAYVMQITGRPADQWLSSEISRDIEATLMPAKAPCAEVAEAVQLQAEVVRVAKQMAELAKAAELPAPDKPAAEKPAAEKSAAEKSAQEKPAAEKPKQARSATELPPSVIGLSLFPNPPRNTSWPTPQSRQAYPSPSWPTPQPPQAQQARPNPSWPPPRSQQAQQAHPPCRPPHPSRNPQRPDPSCW
jgi:hypothetical protein